MVVAKDFEAVETNKYIALNRSKLISFNRDIEWKKLL